MTILWHLIAADLKRNRLLLIAWLVVIAAEATLLAVTPTLDADAAVRASTGLLGSLLWLTELLFTALLVSLVIQTHPLVGSNAFWMTRPIRPDLLLASKTMLLLAAIVAVPVIARIAVMTYYHVPVRHILAVSADTALFRSIWLTALAVMAAVTPTVARFVLLIGGVLVALTIALATATAVALAGIDDAAPSSGTIQVPDPTAEMVLLVLLIVVGVAVLFVQYRNRSRMRSAMIGAAGVAVAMFAAWVWPWPLLALRLETPQWATTSGRPQLVATADTVKASDQTEGMSRRSRWRSVRARVSIDGLEPGWTSQIVLLDAALKVPGQGNLVSAAYGSAEVSARNSEQNPVREAVRAVLGVERLVDPNPVTESASVLTVRESDFRRLEPTVGAYRGRFQIVPTHYEIETRLSLRAGATHQQGAYRIVVDNVDLASGAAQVEARVSNATAMLDRSPDPRRTYYLRNQRLSEAIEGTSDSSHVEFGFLPFSAYSASGSSLGFAAQRMYLEFPTRYNVPGPTITIDNHWLEGAELVVVRATQARPFERTLEIPDFPLRLELPKPMAAETEGGAQP